MLTFENLTSILDRGLQQLKLSEIDFKKKLENPSGQVLHDFVTELTVDLQMSIMEIITSDEAFD
jgi:hypothetical protein